jgi:protoporphyrinogen oxidase
MTPVSCENPLFPGEPAPRASAGLPVVVLGAGPSGLACALELARAGRAVVVLEREALAGGLCATHEQEGYRFDLGGHRLVSDNAALSRDLRSLMGGELLERERRSVVLHEGRSFRYPLDAIDLLRSLGPRANLEALAGYARSHLGQQLYPSPDQTFEQWVSARFGRPLYDRFFGPYTEKLWGIPPATISADWAAQRIGLLHLGDAALRLLGLRRTPLRTYARRYLYPRLGMGQLFARLAAEIERLGGRVRLGATVTGLDLDGSRVVRVRTQVEGREEEIPCASVYGTLALPTLCRMLGPRPHDRGADRQPAAGVIPDTLPDDLGRSAEALKFRAIRFVNLLLRRPSVSPNTWMYVADPRYRIARIQEPRHRSPDMAPPGHTSLMLEMPCTVGDRTWTQPTPALVDETLVELESLGFPVRSDLAGSFSVRVEHGYPIYHLGYQADRRRLLAHVAAFENVLTGGRQGLFRYVFLDAAMEMGQLAARQLLAGKPDQSAIDALRQERTLIEARSLTG